MNFLKSLLVLALLNLAFSFQIQAQITQGAEQAVKKAEEKVLSKAIEKSFNGLVNKLFGSDSTATEVNDGSIDSTKSKSSSSSSGGLFGSKVINKEFPFDYTLEIEITTVDKKGKENVINSHSLYPISGKYVGVETESALNIMDFEEMKNYSIIGGNMTVIGLQSIVDKAQKKAEKEQTKDNEEIPELVKTGRTEVIAGLLCEEYTMNDEEYERSFWMSEELGISPATAALAFTTNPSVNVPNDTKALILKMIMKDIKNNSTTTMLTKSINKDKKSYDLSKYKASDLSRFKF